MVMGRTKSLRVSGGITSESTWQAHAGRDGEQ